MGEDGIMKELRRESLKKKELSVNDIIIFGLKGIYRVEGQIDIALGEKNEKCYELVKMYSQTIHKTYLPQKSISLVRAPIKEILVEELESFVSKINIRPEPFEDNSNKKILAYEKRIKERGFLALIEVYLCVSIDLEVSGRNEKRYCQFKERIFGLIREEIRFANDLGHEEATNFLRQAFSLQKTH